MKALVRIRRGFRGRIIAATCSVVVLSVIVVVQTRIPEPQYDGRTLSEWLATTYDLKDGGWIVGSLPQFKNAMEAMGTNTIPALVHMLTHEDTRVNQLLLQRVFRDVTHPTYNRLGMNRAFFDRERAVIGFKALGSCATNAIPQLLAHRPSGELPHVLDAIGTESLPIVLQFLDNGTENVKFTCLFALQARICDPQLAVRKWVEYSAHPSSKLRFAAVALLLKAPPELQAFARDALRRASSDNDYRVASTAASVLSRLGATPVESILVP
jgi:hypothetical protein